MHIHTHTARYAQHGTAPRRAQSGRTRARTSVWNLLVSWYSSSAALAACVGRRSRVGRSEHENGRSAVRQPGWAGESAPRRRPPAPPRGRGEPARAPRSQRPPWQPGSTEPVPPSPPRTPRARRWRPPARRMLPPPRVRAPAPPPSPCTRASAEPALRTTRGISAGGRRSWLVGRGEVVQGGRRQASTRLTCSVHQATCCAICSFLRCAAVRSSPSKRWMLAGPQRSSSSPTRAGCASRTACGLDRSHSRRCSFVCDARGAGALTSCGSESA